MSALSPTIARRIVRSKRIVVVGGMVVLAVALGVTVGFRLSAHMSQQPQASSESQSTSTTASASGSGTRSNEQIPNATSPEGRREAIPSPDPYARILNDLRDKELLKPVEPFTSGIEHLIEDSQTEDGAHQTVKPVSKKLRGTYTLDDLDSEETPRPKGTLKQIESANLKRLATGAAPFGPGTRQGHSILTVENGTDTDALVMVIRIQQQIRNFYITAGNSFTAEAVPPGHYILRVAFGKDWDAAERRFNVRRSFSQTEYFDMSEEENSGGVTFSRMSITLHKVLNGNFKSHPISEEQFWRLS